MKKVGFIFIFILLGCKSYNKSNEKIEIYITDNNELYKIINVAIESLNKNKINLYDSISSSSYTFWISTLTDSNILQGTDSLIIKQYLAKPGVKQFFDPKLNQFYENYTIKIKLNPNFLTNHTQVELFTSRINNIYPSYYMSYPILSLNKKYAWISIYKRINKNSSYFKVILLQKENGIWKYFSIIDEEAPAIICPKIDKKTIQIIKWKKR